MACGPNSAHSLFINEKLSWNTAMFLHLSITFGCFCATTADFNSCRRLWPTKQKQNKKLPSGTLKKQLTKLGLDEWTFKIIYLLHIFPLLPKKGKPYLFQGCLHSIHGHDSANSGDKRGTSRPNSDSLCSAFGAAQHLMAVAPLLCGSQELSTDHLLQMWRPLGQGHGWPQAPPPQCCRPQVTQTCLPEMKQALVCEGV